MGSSRGRIRASADSVKIDGSMARNAGFALVFLLLAAAASVGFDARVDLSGARLPFTVLYLLALASSAGAAVLRRRLVVERVGAVLRRQTSCFGHRIQERRVEIGAAAAVAVRRGQGPFSPYRLEILPAEVAARDGQRPDPRQPILVDSGMLKTDLEAEGRAMADLLGVPFRTGTEAT